MDFEDMFQYIGHVGPYQLIIFVLVGFLGVFHGYEALGMIFLAYGQDHFCLVEELKELPYEMQREIAIPKDDDSFSKCEVFDLPWSSFNYTDYLTWNRSIMVVNATTLKCQNWNYVLSLFSRTMQTEFDLVCGNEWYIQMASTSYLAGMLVGSFFSGILSDRFGRHKVLIGGTALHPIIGLVIAYSPNIQLLCFMRFLLGVCAFSAFLSGYVYVSELIGPKYRTYACLAYDCTFSIGGMLNSLEAYLVRDYRHLMLVMCLPAFITVSYHWLLPDSARWLNAIGQKEKAIAVIKSIAIINKRSIPADLTFSVEEEKKSKLNIADLFRKSVLRKMTLIQYFLWFTNSLVFYGIALNIGSLVGNVFLNAFISFCCDTVANVIASIVAEKLGRKPALFASFFICGVTNFAIIPLIILKKADWLLLTLTLFGKAGAAAAFSITFLTTLELFPTQIRQVALGSSSTVSRFSGMVAPYIGGPMTTFWKPLPSLIFGLFGLTSALLTLFLRETLQKPMPDTVEDVEKLIKEKPSAPTANLEEPGDVGNANCLLKTLS